MSHEPVATPATARTARAAQPPAPGPERTRAVQMMVAGAVLAILGPLGGFLAGSMIGPAQELGDFDAMFLALFLGLLVGGIGTVLAGAGLLRYARRDAHETATLAADPVVPSGSPRDPGTR